MSEPSTTFAVQYNVDSRYWCDSSGSIIIPSFAQHFWLYMLAIMRISFVHNDGTPADMTDYSITVNLYDEGTTLLMHSTPSDEVSETWDQANDSEGRFAILLNGNTAELANALKGRVTLFARIEFIFTKDNSIVGVFTENVYTDNVADGGELTPISLAEATKYGNVSIPTGSSFIDLADVSTNLYVIVNALVESPASATESYYAQNVSVVGGKYRVYFNATVQEEGNVLRFAYTRKEEQ